MFHGHDLIFDIILFGLNIMHLFLENDVKVLGLMEIKNHGPIEWNPAVIVSFDLTIRKELPIGRFFVPKY